jgi:hypothetical protein
MSRTRTRPPALLAGLAALVAAIGCGRPPKDPPPPGPPLEAMPTPFFSPGLPCPPVHPAGEVQLPDDAQVVGVVAGGKPRAYLLSAMSSINQHVINDLIGDVAVTVTYCNRTKCVRSFTGDADGDVLPVDLGGWNERMILRVKNKFYWQHSGEPIASAMGGPFPYERLSHELTTWKAWRKAHPDTDVFTGK